MKGKIVWLVMSCLMAAVLVLASCAAAEEEEVVTPEEEEEVVTEEEVVVTEEKETVRDALGRVVEKPQYGGVFNVALSSDIRGFDETTTYPWMCYTLNFTNDEMMTGNWVEGPGGTGEASWRTTELMYDLQTGCLAKSFELPDNETIIFHLHEGVHFIDKPPVNGREVVADDFVFSLQRIFDVPSSYMHIGFTDEERATISITAPDKYTAVVKFDEKISRSMFEVSDFCRVIAPEVVELYGDTEDWRNSVGSGPFALVDYVPMSSFTLERNPNYWRKHPLYPEDTMPYLDGIKFLVIPDASTRISALRTGKVGYLGLDWENGESVIASNPELEHLKGRPGACSMLHFRLDKPELPFSDIRVRQALALAIDNQEIADEYYGGNALIHTYPVAPVAEFIDMYNPIEELPEVVQELYEYHPDKAKQLLAEAGYPNGFQTKIACTATSADLLAIVKAYWEKIGVILELSPLDSAVFTGMAMGRRYKEMIIYTSTNTLPSKMTQLRPEFFPNQSKVDDPFVNELWDELDAMPGPMTGANWDRMVEIYHDELNPYVLEQVFAIELPGAFSYVFWHPWVKDYHGESSIGYFNTYNWLNYVWIDQDLKYEVTGTR